MPSWTGQSLWRRQKALVGSGAPPLCRFPSPAGFASKRPKSEGNGHLSRREERRRAQRSMKVTFLMPPVVSYPRLQPFRISSSVPQSSFLLTPWPLAPAPWPSAPLPALPQSPVSFRCSSLRRAPPVAALRPTSTYALMWHLEAFPGYWCSLK